MIVIACFIIPISATLAQKRQPSSLSYPPFNLSKAPQSYIGRPAPVQQPQRLAADAPLGADEFDYFLGDLGLAEPDYAGRVVEPVSPGVPGPGGVPGSGGTGTPPPRFPEPRTFSWRDRGILSPVRHQLRCASCYAFAGVGVLETNIRRLFNKSYDLAEQQPISCDNRQFGCRGGSMRVFSYWEEVAPVQESCQPYQGPEIPCKDACTNVPYLVKTWNTYYRGDELSIKEAIRTKGPGYMSFLVYYPFYNYWRGYGGKVFKMPTNSAEWGQLRGGHACVLIGWDDDKRAWELQNSWGLSPAGPEGDGRIWLSYDSADTMRYGFGFVELKEVGGGEGQNIGQSPVSCETHKPCYETREPKKLVDDLYDGINVEWVTGCYCKDFTCQIEYRRNGVNESSDCAYCKDKCYDPDFQWLK